MSETLYAISNRVRILSLLQIHNAGSGHPGGTLSACDLITYIWVYEIDCFDGKQGFANHGNRFVLSKGHACPALYAAVAECGVIETSELEKFRKIGSPLQGHPDVGKFPWAFASTGSLGQGFSSALGMALGLRYINSPYRVYVMVGDGELQEGQIWEGAMCAAHHKLDNFCVVIDRNKLQSDELTENLLGLEPLRDKWESFNWHVLEIDGHDYSAIESAFNTAKTIRNKPTVIIADTVKGKGVSYMENSPNWHGSVKLRDEELVIALRELGASDKMIDAYLDDSSWNG